MAVARPSNFKTDSYPDIDWSHPSAKGLHHFWWLGEGGGLISRDLVTKDQGVLTNMVPTAWDAGKGGRHLQFDGSNDYVLGKSNFGGMTHASFECYVMLLDGVGGNYGAAWCGHTAYNGSFFIGREVSGNQLQVFINGKNLKTLEFDFDVWQHVVFTYEASTEIRIYVDGKYITNDVSAIPASINAHTQCDIGGCPTSNLYSGWRVEYCRGWNRVLSAAEVRALYRDRYGLVRPRRKVFAVPVAPPSGFVPYPHPRGLDGGVQPFSGGMQ